MSDQEQRDAVDDTYGLPAQLEVFDPILSRQAEGIIEYARRQFEGDSGVLLLIGEVLVLIPREPDQRHILNVTTKS